MKKSILLRCKLALLFVFITNSLLSQTQCGVDTVNYTYLKTSQFRGVTLNAASSGNAFAQWFPAPQAITIEGFDFYAWQSAGTNAKVDLTCNLYRAGNDSMPTGPALRSVTVTVDSSFGSGQLTTLIKHAVFTTAIQMTSAYVITVENATSTSVSVLSNDYAATNPNGRSEWLSSVRIGANYNRSYDINVGGIPFNADFIFRPYVKYTLTADFVFAGCNAGGNTINFNNKSSSVINSPFYNRYAFYNITQFCFRWDYGDTSGSSYAINGNHKYNYKVQHDVTLKDTLYGWFKGCSDSKTKTVYANPNPPVVHNTGPVCSGDSVKLYVDTVPDTEYLWGGPNGFTAKITDTTLVNTVATQSGTYAVIAYKNGCPSNPQNMALQINQSPAKPVASNNGSKCVGDTSVFTATSSTAGVNYTWTGPNGFSSASSAFSFNNVDTTLRGEYIVYVEDALCKSVPDTVDLYVYPPPQPPIVSAINKAVCEQDSLHLKGASVAGAVLSWTGPNGFNSFDTDPVIAAAALTDAGVYKAHVIIGSCSSTSDSVNITVNPKPSVSIASNGATTFCNGDSVAIDATVLATTTYQWQKNNINMPPAIGKSFVAKASGKYRVIVTNAFMCRDTSTEETVIVKPLPTITQHPTPQLARDGWDVGFDITSPETGVTYQWQEDRGTGFFDLSNVTPYSGVQTNSLAIKGVDDGYHNFQYRCVVSLAGCETTSSIGVITINISVGEIAKDINLKLYPNPTSSLLSLDINLDKPQQVSYSVTDVLGKEHIAPVKFMADGIQHHKVDVSTLSKGVYFLKLQTTDSERTIRFVVE